jgi:Zn-dependent protease
VSFLKLLQKQITVARVFGIPVRVDYRWFFVFVITVWLMAENISGRVAEIGKNGALALGIVATLAYFFSIFGHEMAHALAARFEGIQTLEIVLHPFGGLARLSREPDSPKAEFRIGIAGPAASFLFAGLFFLIAVLIDSFAYQAAPRNVYGYVRAGAASFFLIGFGNLLLAVFNLFPGYPLDGGRVLRAFLWKRNGDINRSTLIAGRAGQIIAIAFGTLGLFIAAVRHDLFTGIFTVLVGVFLFDAALNVVNYARGVARLTAAEVMTNPFTIEPDLLVSQLVDTILPMHRQTAFLVAKERKLHGVLALADVRSLARERWHRLRVREVMRPVAPELFVLPETPLSQAKELIERNGVAMVAVLDRAGDIAGVVTGGKLKSRS